MSEIQNPFNIRYKPWREFLISSKVQDLIINGICKGFPYVGDFFYIKDIKKTLFDNYVQYMKIEHSDLVTYIARQLLEAQRSTYKTIGNVRRKKKKRDKKGQIVDIIKTDSGEPIKRLYKLNLTDEESKFDDMNIADSIEEIDFWLSEKFQILHDKINDPIEYGKREIIMSNAAFGMLSEFVGRTFHDFLLLNDPVTGSKSFTYETGDPLNNYSIWSKYIFEIIYDLLSMNIHLGIIHGDLHLNNFTIHPMYFTEHTQLSNLLKQNIFPYMLFIMKTDPKSEERVVYGFESTQYHSCIIDFGRSIIRPSKIDSFKDNNIKMASKLNLYKKGPIQLLGENDKDIFYREQVYRILNILNDFFPDFYKKNKLSLENLILSSFEELFPLLTVIDVYRFSLEVKKYLSLKKELLKTKQYKLIWRINNKAENIILNKLQKLIDNPKLIEAESYKMFSNWEIISEEFSEFIVMSSFEDEWKTSEFVESINKKKNTIIDVSILDNEIKYSLDTYDKFPNFLKENLKKKFKGIKKSFEDEEILNKLKRTSINEEKRKNLQIMSLIAKRHKEKLFDL